MSKCEGMSKYRGMINRWGKTGLMFKYHYMGPNFTTLCGRSITTVWGAIQWSPSQNDCCIECWQHREEVLHDVNGQSIKIRNSEKASTAKKLIPCEVKSKKVPIKLSNQDKKQQQTIIEKMKNAPEKPNVTRPDESCQEGWKNRTHRRQ